jgi:DNA-binding NarL/FixJ family response regulator
VRPRLEGLAIGLWGRHELYLMSLLELIADLGGETRLLADPAAALSSRANDSIDVLVLESPFPSELSRASQTGAPVVVLQERGETGEVREALSLGASAVLQKNASLGELVRAIRAAVDQQPPGAARNLTGRQREVLRLLAEGLDNTQIAARLGISARTARAHVSAVLERLGVENRTQAAVTAVREGYIG